MTSQGWNGITIDLESLNNFGAAGHTRDDNAGLDAFAKELRAALPKSSISICLIATTGSYADLGYDVTTLGASVDHVVLMAYDQHGPTWSSAGPIGGLPWAKSSLKALTRALPAAEIQLGIGEYGYSWPSDSVGGSPRGGGPYTVAQARALVKKNHATARWDSTQQEWHATLPDGTTIWWSDARSYRRTGSPRPRDAPRRCGGLEPRAGRPALAPPLRPFGTTSPARAGDVGPNGGTYAAA